MLTIEEQIERIADEAVERASAPMPSPRRWPAMAAAAALILVAGSVVWMATSRGQDADPTVAPVTASTPDGSLDPSVGWMDQLQQQSVESAAVTPVDGALVTAGKDNFDVTFGDAAFVVGMPVVNDFGLVGRVVRVDSSGIASVQPLTADGFSIGAVAVVENDAAPTGVVFGTGDPQRVTFTRIEDTDQASQVANGTAVVTAGGAQSTSPAGIPIGRVIADSSASEPGTRSSAVDPVWDEAPDSDLRVLIYLPFESDALAQRLEGAEGYPLSSVALGDDVDGLGVLVEEPGSRAAVDTSDGVTIFRASGLNSSVSGFAYEGRCAGIVGVSLGCDAPGIAGLPWIIGTPFAPESDRLSIWVDVPVDTAAVLITDGTTVRWQRPVNGLAVWPAPTNPDWTAEAIDADGITIVTVDESTNEQLRAAAAEELDPADTAELDAAALQQVRDCLQRAGATFGSDGTRPVFANGVDTNRIWDDCVTSRFDERSTNSSEPAGEADQVVLPTSLPVGWRVFAVSRTSSIVRPVADQVFGRSEQNGVTGLRVVVTSNEFLGVGQGAEQIDLRGHDAGIVRVDDGWSVQWGERGRLVDVTSRGLDRETLLATLEQLEFRSDPSAGFEPSSTSSDLPLLVEAVTNETTPQVTTMLRLVEGDALPSRPDANGTEVIDRTIRIFISDGTGFMGSAPQIVFTGERRGDLVVAPDPSGSSGLAAVLADGTITMVRLPDGVTEEVAEALLDGLAPQPTSTLVAMLDEVSRWFARLPEVRSAAIDDQHTIRLRGGTADNPDAMCLEVGGIERCTLAMVASPIGDPSWINGVVIEGRWYLFGFEPADQGSLAIAPWRSGETLDPLASIGSIVDGTHYWLSEIPIDVDDVQILDLPATQARETTFRRPDR